MVGKTFSADLKSMYDYIGKRETEYGFSIERSKNDDNEYYDLRGNGTTILICDGETCEVTECEDDCISVVCHEFGTVTPIRFSQEELNIISGNIVGTCNRCGYPLYPSIVDGYKYVCHNCDEDFYGFEQE